MPWPLSDDSERLSTVLALLEKILRDGTNENRRYCKYCKIIMKSPVELHKTDCAWRIAWELVNQRSNRGSQRSKAHGWVYESSGAMKCSHASG